MFHDVKEVWGAGQQQVRHLGFHIGFHIGTGHLNRWRFTLTELWAGPLKAKQLPPRDDSPGDTLDRRPSHADKRKALQTQCFLTEFTPQTAATTLPPKIHDLLQRLLRLTVSEGEMPESADSLRGRILSVSAWPPSCSSLSLG